MTVSFCVCQVLGEIRPYPHRYAYHLCYIQVPEVLAFDASPLGWIR